jgi:diguanylate cyclase (GGDEF)-like protein
MTVARLSLEVRRDHDVIGRFGGDEIVALLPGTDQEAAVGLAQRLIDAVATQPTTISGNIVPVTLSIGVADSGGDEPLLALLARADDALYKAKAAGRGIVVGYLPTTLAARASQT